MADHPEQQLCWVGLAELHLTQQRWAEFEPPLAWLGSHTDAVVLRARGQLALCEFDEARRLLADLIAREPTALLPRVLLSYVLLQEGRDMPAAEQALCNVLVLAPHHAETRRNLAVVRARDVRRTPIGAQTLNTRHFLTRPCSQLTVCSVVVQVSI